MTSIRRAVFAGLATALLAVPAWADEEMPTETAHGFYVGGFIGLAWGTGDTRDRFDVDGPDLFDTFHLVGEVDDGHIFGAVAGWHLSEYIRIEGEVSRSELDTFSDVAEQPCSCSNQNLDITYYMANLWIGMDVTEHISPYIGGGVGLADYEGAFDPQATPIDGTSFAYQLGGGIRIAVGDSPLEFDIGYRFKSIPDAEYDKHVLVEVTQPGGPSVPQNIIGNGDDDFELGEHIAQIGVNFNFR